MDTTRPSSTNTPPSSVPSATPAPSAIASFFSRVQALVTPRRLNTRVDDIMHLHLSDARENTLFTDDPEKVKNQTPNRETTTGWHKIDDRV